ncbi:MAG TPA: bifunctional [glutamine synthetase] adenylyltransferase/[glutamine synthetase]-adenylyl-L-tyrosine phosphorylase [Acidimicrobiales bacterium]|nr:bifunctional [glutamine synthetase] adenylyltransferase/[glutamine synthetase]-adenylyl-L-tyrosine phosphorylase [Acidimicrobiales bacterium]
MAALTEAIERSVDPPAVERTVGALVEAAPPLQARLEADRRLRDALVAVVGASRSLGRLLVTDASALEVLADLDRREARPAGGIDTLVDWKRRELLRIAARDLLGLDALEAVGERLSALADDVLAGCLALAGEPAAGLAVVAMGKLGARELNYASDVDIVFAGRGDARGVLDLGRRCFRVDTNLRPEGRDGPLVRTVESYEAYWDRWAQPWEFQALIKARTVAGHAEVQRAFAAAALERVWGRPFGAEELRSVRRMKARSESRTARRGLADRELKLGRGGIRDIEFAVQILQLVHGRHDAALRVPATMAALAELAAAGYVDPADGAALADAYRYLRTAEHRLQLFDEQQVHALPRERPAQARLALSMGYRDDAGGAAVDRFLDDLRRHQAAARAIHERLYFRPLLEAFAGSGGDDRATPGMAPEAVEQRLTAFGFADADRTRVALRELTRGLTRSSRLMAQLLPLVLQWLSESPDPDLGLLGLRALVTGSHRASRLVETFRESPEAARQLCLLLGTSRLLQRGFEQHPDAIRALGDGSVLHVRTAAELRERMRAAAALPHPERSLLRAKEAEELRIATRDVLGATDVHQTATQLTALSEAVLATVLEAASGPPMAVVAMGRFGGGELSYASDLDVLFVHDARSPDEAAAAESVAEEVLRRMNGASPASRLGAIDANLRPEGKQGPLSRSLEGYATYYRRWARTWERQALLRARMAVGDEEIGRRFLDDVVAGFVWAPLSADAVREIRRMKARIERERIPPGEDPQFHLKLGRGSLSDVEWTVQLLQLRHGVAGPNTMAALDALEEAGAVFPADAEILRASFAFCERARNRLYLVKGGPADSLPGAADQLGRLARSLGVSSTELRERYRRVTRRARAVFERLFYEDGGR